jgi:hypothetical protein
MDMSELIYILEGYITLNDALLHKIDAAEQEGRFYARLGA